MHKQRGLDLGNRFGDAVMLATSCAGVGVVSGEGEGGLRVDVVSGGEIPAADTHMAEPVA